MGLNPKAPFDLEEFLRTPAHPDTIRVIAARRRRLANGVDKEEPPEVPKKNTKLTE